MPFARSLPFSLALFVAGASLPGLAGAADAPAGAPPAPEVIVETAKPAPLPLILEYAGRTAGYREVEVRAQVSGSVQKLDQDKGNRVAADQLLLSISPDDRPAQVARSEADVRQRQSDVGKGQKPAEPPPL